MVKLDLKEIKFYFERNIVLLLEKKKSTFKEMKFYF